MSTLPTFSRSWLDLYSWKRTMVTREVTTGRFVDSAGCDTSCRETSVVADSVKQNLSSAGEWESGCHS